MTKYTFIVAWLLLFTYSSFAQKLPGTPAAIHSLQQQGEEFSQLELFNNPQSVARQSELKTSLAQGTLLDLDLVALELAVRKEAGQIQLSIPTDKGQHLVLLLEKINLFSSDFQVKTSSGDRSFPQELGLHYRGIIQGEKQSMVSISLYKTGVMALISTTQDNWVLGKLEGRNAENQHVLYNHKDLAQQVGLNCHTLDDGKTYSTTDLQLPTSKAAPDKCVDIYIEVDQDIYNNKGANTTAYVTGIFNQSATLFANDGISLKLSELFIWTKSSPYTGSSSSALLNQFQSHRTSFNGDLGHLLTLDSNYGGVAAGFDGLCNPDRAQSQCFSGIQTSYNNVPTYSWTIMVFSHEMGHLLGSRHTHACVWNGNNTAIDGCSGFTEGSCPIPGLPSNGGTIMSYCHNQSVGINFNLGFGAQPKAVIHNRINSASCLADCSACPSDLLLTGTISNSQNYSAANSISSTQLLNNNANVQYKAGTLITLNPGFKAKDGTDFYAYIEDCGHEAIPKQEVALVEEEIIENTGILLEESAKDSAKKEVAQIGTTALHCYPNPFNNSTTIEYSLKEKTTVNLSITDLTGRLVQQITDENQAAGQYRLTFNAQDLPAGMYLARLQAGPEITTVKLLLMNR